MSVGMQGRLRVRRRALDVARRAPVSCSARARICQALDHCPATLRRMIALLLIEQLTETEVALALGIPRREVTRAHAALRSELRWTLSGFRFRASRFGGAHPRLTETATLRRAS